MYYSCSADKPVLRFGHANCSASEKTMLLLLPISWTRLAQQTVLHSPLMARNAASCPPAWTCLAQGYTVRLVQASTLYEFPTDIDMKFQKPHVVILCLHTRTKLCSGKCSRMNLWGLRHAWMTRNVLYTQKRTLYGPTGTLGNAATNAF